MSKGAFRIVAGALVVAVIVSLAIVRRPHPLEGKPAPDILLPLMDGGTLDLAAHRGKDVVVLDFWATWCPPCVESLPALDALAKDYADKGVAVYAINQGEDPAEIAAFLRSGGLTLPVALDPGFATGRDYLVEAIPQTVIVGKDGLVKRVHVGAGPGFSDELRGELDEISTRGKSPFRVNPTYIEQT